MGLKFFWPLDNWPLLGIVTTIMWPLVLHFSFFFLLFCVFSFFVDKGKRPKASCPWPLACHTSGSHDEAQASFSQSRPHKLLKFSTIFGFFLCEDT